MEQSNICTAAARNLPKGCGRRLWKRERSREEFVLAQLQLEHVGRDQIM